MFTPDQQFLQRDSPPIEVHGTEVTVDHSFNFDDPFDTGFNAQLKQLVVKKFPRYKPYLDDGRVTLKGKPQIKSKPILDFLADRIG